MPRSASERASMGGKARAEKLSPERRREIAQKAYAARMAKAVQEVLDKAPPFTPEQVRVLRAVFANTPTGRGEVKR